MARGDHHPVEESRCRKTEPEIKKMIKDALRPIRFNKGRGYFFGANFNGVEQLFPDKPEPEGKNLIHMKDTDSRFVIQDMIAHPGDGVTLILKAEFKLDGVTRQCRPDFLLYIGDSNPGF